MSRGYNRPLCLLPFDHRHSSVTGLFKFTPPLTAGEHRVVVDSKRVIDDGCRQAVDSDVPILAPRARAVVRTIIEAGIAFTITGGRPPLGMKRLIDDLDLREPVTAFNGGLVVRPDLSIIREHLVSAKTARSVIGILARHECDV